MQGVDSCDNCAHVGTSRTSDKAMALRQRLWSDQDELFSKLSAPCVSAVLLLPPSFTTIAVVEVEWCTSIAGTTATSFGLPTSTDTAAMLTGTCICVITCAERPLGHIQVRETDDGKHHEKYACSHGNNPRNAKAAQPVKDFRTARFHCNKLNGHH